jgi:hypothetical protein
MESLTSFVKNSTALDLLIVMLIIGIAAILIVGGILIVIRSRSRMPIFFFLILTLLPLLFGILGSYSRYIRIERELAQVPNASAEVDWGAVRQEALITTYIGAVGTAIPGLIGMAGLVLKKEKRA